MTNEILKDEMLNDAALDGVAGGTYTESYQDMMYLYQYCGINFNPNSREASVAKLAALYQRAGTIFQAHNNHDNFYADGYGRPVTRQTALYDLACKINGGMIYIEDLRH